MLFLSDFNETCIFYIDFRKTQISNFNNIRPVGAELFHTDGHDEANSRFSQLCEGAYKDVQAARFVFLIMPDETSNIL